MKRTDKKWANGKKITSSVLLILFLTFLLCGGWSDGERKGWLEVKAGTVWNDGTYAIPVSFWNATSNAASMGNGALEQSGKLVVKDNEAILYLHLKSLSYADMSGYLMQLDLLQNITLNTNQYPTRYELLNGTVVSTYDITDVYNAVDSTDAICAGKAYPKVVSVPVTLDQAYIWAHIYVPVMGSLGFGDQLLRIKPDYSAAAEMTAEQIQMWDAYETSDLENSEENTEKNIENENPASTDKSGLKAKIEKAKTLLAQTDVYTEATLTNLKDAVATAQNVYDNAAVSQASVNAQITALQNAIDALVKKSSEVLDKDHLKDGKYNVYIALWNAVADRASMGDAAMNHTALLTVKNGIYKLDFSTHPMTVGTITACLQSMEIEQTNGSYKAAVITAKKNMVEGKAMASAFSFTMPSKEGYINVKIDPKVAVMGTDPLAARLKISWDTLKSVSDDTKVSENTDTVTSGLDTPAVDLTDAGTKIRIKAAENILAEGVSMKVSAILEGSDYEIVKAALAGWKDSFTLYDITLYNSEGLQVEPGGRVTVYIPLPEGYEADKIAVYRFEDAAKTKLSAEAENGYVVFQTGSFGKFAIADTGNSQLDAEESSSQEELRTAGKSSTQETASGKGKASAGKEADVSGKITETASEDLETGNQLKSDDNHESAVQKAEMAKNSNSSHENQVVTLFFLGASMVGSICITVFVVGFILTDSSLRRKKHHDKKTG